VRDDIPIPKPGHGELLIKVCAIGLNPVDWKMHKYGALIKQYPAVIGCDVAGIVEAVGPGVSNYSVGDEVLAFEPLGEPGHGAYEQHTLVDIRTTIKKPRNLSFDQAATVPCAALTAALGLFHHFGIKIPKVVVGQTQINKQPMLVWGASSGVGLFVVQMAKLAGFSVIGLCSPHNFDFVRSMGAEHVLDYHSNTVVEDIKKLGNIKYCFDVIGDATAELACQCLATDGFLISCATSRDFKPKTGVKYESVFLGGAYITKGAELNKLTEYMIYIREWLESGVLKPLAVRKLTNGLEGIAHGLVVLEAGKVSGMKLVAVP
jgi:NADPH:quinone reductase-like Zn-dependent oxidoreductase